MNTEQDRENDFIERNWFKLFIAIILVFVGYTVYDHLVIQPKTYHQSQERLVEVDTGVTSSGINYTVYEEH